MAISGRRQQVLDGAVAALHDEGISAIGLQVWPHPSAFHNPEGNPRSISQLPAAEVLGFLAFIMGLCNQSVYKGHKGL